VAHRAASTGWKGDIVTSSSFKSGLASGRTVWAAGAFDALSGRLVEQAGFDAVFTTGFGISAAFLGRPDAELYTMTENLTVVGNVCAAVASPVIADIDTGYGGPVNVMRTISEFERAGVSGVILEDQVSPKRCPLSSKDLAVSDIDFSIAKLRAAIEARKRSDLIVIARTDEPSIDGVIQRARLYLEAGADVIQPTSRGIGCYADIERLCDAIGAKVSLQIVGWLERDLDAAQIERVAAVATFPLVGLMSAAEAMRENLNALGRAHSARGLPCKVAGHDDFSRMIGFGELDALQRRLLPI
jgi:methylisocitrate lyase